MQGIGAILHISSKERILGFQTFAGRDEELQRATICVAALFEFRHFVVSNHSAGL